MALNPNVPWKRPDLVPASDDGCLDLTLDLIVAGSLAYIFADVQLKEVSILSPDGGGE